MAGWVCLASCQSYLLLLAQSCCQTQGKAWVQRDLYSGLKVSRSILSLKIVERADFSERR